MKDYYSYDETGDAVGHLTVDFLINVKFTRSQTLAQMVIKTYLITVAAGRTEDVVIRRYEAVDRKTKRGPVEKMDITDCPIMIYVFDDGAYPYTADFTNVLKKVKLIPMPYAFLRGIKDSLPEEPSSWVDNSELTDDEKAKLMEEAIKAENNEE